MYLSLKVLDLLYLLVKYGYYADRKDIDVLMPPLISLLDGKNDLKFPKVTNILNSSFKQVML